MPVTERQKPGPKPKPPELQRTARIPVHVNAVERQRLRVLAHAAGLTVSVYLRKKGLQP